FFPAEDGIRDFHVTGVQTCALPISFVVGGLSTSLNLSSNENNPDDNYDGQFRMTTNSYYYEIGFGIDLYLYYFKFSPSIRGVFAINDELVRDENANSMFTSNVDKMSSRRVFINFTFQ